MENLQKCVSGRVQKVVWIQVSKCLPRLFCTTQNSTVPRGAERKRRNPAQGSRDFGAPYRPRNSTPRFSNSGSRKPPPRGPLEPRKGSQGPGRLPVLERGKGHLHVIAERGLGQYPFSQTGNCVDVFPFSPRNRQHINKMDAAFLLTVGSFLLTMELFTYS